MTPNDLLNVAQVAEELDLSVRAVHHRISSGTLHATKVGTGRTSAYVITRAELDRVKAAEHADRATG